MYKDLRPKEEVPVTIIINVSSLENSCGGCPTIYDFKDNEGTSYYFRLRHGGARIVCEDTDEVLLSGSMDGFDGVCDFDDVINWARENGIQINY